MSAHRRLCLVVIIQPKNIQYQSALSRQDIIVVLSKKKDTSRKVNDKCSLTLSKIVSTVKSSRCAPFRSVPLNEC
jgi:hypothetical protein